MHSVFLVERVHVAGVIPDDDHVDDQGALSTHPERERPSEKIERQFARVVADNKGDDEPDGEQDPGDAQVLAPVLMVLLGQLHDLPLLWRPVGINTETRRADAASLHPVLLLWVASTRLSGFAYANLTRASILTGHAVRIPSLRATSATLQAVDL